jgi:hypothetical protein
MESVACRLTGSTVRSAAAAAPQSLYWNLAPVGAVPVQINKGRERNLIERNSIERNSDLSRFCEMSLHHGILRKTGRVRVDLNSENREGSVAIGPDAIRGRLRELQNILLLVQIKDENWTKYESNLSINFSYIDTDIDIDPPIIAHWFPSLGGGGDDNGSFHRVCPPIKRRNSDCNDDGGKEKKKNHLWMTTATKKTKKKKTNGGKNDDNGEKKRRKNHSRTTAATKKTM